MLQKKSRRSWVWTWQDSEIKDFSQEGPDVQGTASPLDDKRQREGAAWAIAAVAIADIAKRRELLPLPLPALESQEEREERRGTRAAAGLCSTLSLLLLLLRCPGCVCTAVLLCLLSPIHILPRLPASEFLRMKFSSYIQNFMGMESGLSPKQKPPYFGIFASAASTSVLLLNVLFVLHQQQRYQQQPQQRID